MSSDRTDAELIREAESDAGAFGELYRGHVAAVLDARPPNGFAPRRVSNPNSLGQPDRPPRSSPTGRS
jgi:hypothetical protein